MVDALTRVDDSAVELLILDQLPGVGPVKVRRLVERFGSARAALNAPRPAFSAVAGSRAARARSDSALRDAATEALGRAEASGIEVITWNDDVYPDPLRALADPPPVLFLRGRVGLLEGTGMVTVVGARRATGRGREVASRLGACLGRVGITVVSGLAL